MAVTFSPAMFPGLATFVPPALKPSVYNAPALAVLSGGTQHPCSVQVDQSAARSESYRSPEGRQRWLVFTPTDPGCSLDWRVLWNGRIMAVVAKPVMADGWAVWQTSCEEIS